MKKTTYAACAVAVLLIFGLSLWGAYQLGIHRGIDIEGSRTIKSAYEAYTSPPPTPPTDEQKKRWPFTDKIH